MTIEALEDELLEVVQTVITSDIAETITLPEDDDMFTLPTGPKGRVCVAFDMLKYEECNVMYGVVQPRDIFMYITIQSRTLRGPSGIYTMFGLIEAAVIGYTLSDCELPLHAKYFGTPEVGTKPRVDDIWTFEYHVKTRGVLVQDIPTSGNVNTSPYADGTTLPLPPDFPDNPTPDDILNGMITMTIEEGEYPDFLDQQQN